MNFKCHACGRTLPNRSRRSCQYCGATLDQSQQITGARQEFLQKLKADEVKRHREFMERDISTGGGASPPLPGGLF
jgi:hypothetical protein